MTKTLLEMSEDYKDSDPKRADALRHFAENSDILGALVFEDIPGGSFSYVVEGTLIEVAFRGHNEIYPNIRGCGALNPQTEHLQIVGGSLDVNAQIVKDKGADERDVHEMLKIKALACGVSGCFINGDSELDIRQFDGIKKRIIGAQLVGVDEDSPYSNGPLSISSLKRAIKKVTHPTHLIMSKATRTRLSAASRTCSDAVAGDLKFELNELGEQVMFYKDLPILIADYDDTGSRIIDFNEEGPAGAVGGTQCTSVYIVSLSAKNLVGIQNGVMGVDDLGLLDSSDKYNNIEADVYRTRVEWLMCIAVLYGRAASRIWGITNEAVTE